MSSATRIDLLRHGEATGGRRLRGARTDDPPSPRGLDEMRRVLRAAGPWDALVASPLQRCRACAQEAADEMGIPLAVEPRLAEYDFGEWSGRDVDDLWAEQGDALATFFADPDLLTPPGGEAAPAFRERVRGAWADLLARHGGARVLVIGHGGVLRQLVGDVLGLPGSSFRALEWPHAALSRVRVFDDPDHGRSATLVFHARAY